MPLVKFCREKEIELTGLYPNSTNIMQPLDIAFFYPFKEAWKKIVPKWKNENNMKQLKKEDVGVVLKKTLESIPEENIKNDFKACGLVPFHPNAIDYDILNNRKSKQPVSLEDGESNDQHLQKFEDNLKQMSADLLQEFENDLPTGLWTGSLEKKALFEHWYKLKSSKTEFSVCTKDSGTENVFHEEKILRKGTIEESIPLNQINQTLENATLAKPLIVVINASNMTSQENVPIEFGDDEDLRSDFTSSYEKLKENYSALANLDLPVIGKTNENCSILANLNQPVIEKTNENCSVLANLD